MTKAVCVAAVGDKVSGEDIASVALLRLCRTNKLDGTKSYVIQNAKWAVLSYHRGDWSGMRIIAESLDAYMENHDVRDQYDFPAALEAREELTCLMKEYTALPAKARINHPIHPFRVEVAEMLT